jgi:hypothetical protein
MDDIIQVPLDLPDVRVLSTHRTEQGRWRFCQVIEAETHIRQTGAPPRSYPPFRGLRTKRAKFQVRSVTF